MPYLVQPFPDLLDICLIGSTSGIDPLGDLVDIPANGRQFGGERFDIGGVGVDDISIDRHLAKIGTIPVRGELGHPLFNELFFFLRDIEFHLNIPLADRHTPPPF